MGVSDDRVNVKPLPSDIPAECGVDVNVFWWSGFVYQ